MTNVRNISVSTTANPGSGSLRANRVPKVVFFKFARMRFDAFQGCGF